MRGTRPEALVLAVILTAFAFLLVAGHSRWAGSSLIYVVDNHGLNVGDVGVLVAWAAGMVLTWRLGRRRREP